MKQNTSKMSRILEVVRTQVVWPFAGWLVVIGPLLLLLASHLLPNMLEGLVLLRTDGWYYFLDGYFLTIMSMVLSSFGIAIIRIYDLYAKNRFGHESSVAAIHNPSSSLTTDSIWWTPESTAWPRLVWCLWFLASLPYPICCFLITNSNIAKIPSAARAMEVNGLWFWLGLLLGVLSAMLWLLVVSLVHLAFNRRVASACGLFPLEDLAIQLLDKFLGPVSTLEPMTQKAKWTRHLPFVPGITEDKPRRILPGHFQLSAMMALAALVYYCLFDSSYRRSGWSSSNFPVGFYALLLIFLIGGTVAFICFVIGRCRINLGALVPIAIFGVFALSLVANYGHWVFIDTNRYFELSPIGHKPDEIARKSGDNNYQSTFMRVFRGSTSAVSQNTAVDSSAVNGDLTSRKTLREVYKNWRFPPGPDGKATMVVIAASGGGIQASAWTAKVLANMDQQCPAFSESIGLVSGVSGGSVGSMYYVGKRGFRVNPTEYPKSGEDRLNSCMRSKRRALIRSFRKRSAER